MDPTRHVYEVEIRASPTRVWEVLCDVEQWPQWTDSMTRLELLDGPLAVGRRVRIKQPRFPRATWTVTKVEPERGFSWSAKGFGFTTHADHDIEPTETGCTVTLRITLTGPFAGIFGRFTAKRTDHYMRMEGTGLRRRAESS